VFVLVGPHVRRQRRRGAPTWHGAPTAAVGLASVVTIDDVRSVATDLPRSYEVVVRGRVKFRVGRIVYLDFSRDQSIMGFAFPREWRPVLVSSAPDKFMLPIDSELRWNWVRVRLAAIDMAEMRELVLDAWSMVVPKRVAAAYAAPLSRAAMTSRLRSG
jgi:hypothetical protein